VLGTGRQYKGGQRNYLAAQRRDVTSRGIHAEPDWGVHLSPMGNIRGDHDEEPQDLRPDQTHHKIYLRNAISSCCWIVLKPEEGACPQGH
jgi:hypothetical protein